MALLLLLLLTVGAAVAVWGLRWMMWGTRFLKGHRVPEGFRYPSRFDGDPQRLGFVLLLYGMMVMSFGNFTAISAGSALLRGPEYEVSIAGEKLRLFSASSSPWLDIGKIIVVNWIVISLLLGARILRRPQEQDGPSAGEGQSVVKGWWLIATGTLVCLATATSCVYLTVQVGFGDGADGPLLILMSPVVGFVSPVVYMAGLNLRRRGRRHLIPTIAKPGELAPDSYVLYLRSFSDDAAFDRVQDRVGSPVMHQFFIPGRSEEEQLAYAVKRLGPLVAVGQPGETLPYAGARRLYLPEDGWESVVSNMMSDARLVVLSLGPGRSTMWELVEAARILPPERLVLLAPMQKKEYEEFRTKAHERLRVLPDPPPLPPYTPDPRQKYFDAPARIKALIHYARASDGRTWQPYFVWLEAELIPMLRFAEFRNKVYVALKHGLRPVVDHLTTGRAKGPQQLPSFNAAGRISVIVVVLVLVGLYGSRCSGAGG
ncbi:hypothetical protein ABZ760_25835 [Streptomyces sp. NPDC006658]|uniref:hypothetical protein n=1 Tax=Streptomyces sp. NPDC006658 TaxID=3156900 RepID=UPI0033FF65AF